MPVLRVSDMQRAIDWYTHLLGFEVHSHFVFGGVESCVLQIGATRLRLFTGSHAGGKPAFNDTLYFERSGVRELWNRIRDQVEIVKPLELMEYGTLEFRVRDPDGYALAFVEPAVS